MASDGETSCANDPNFAAIYSFLKVFGKLYGLEVPTIAKLQEFIENTQEVSETLKELHLRLLRRALKSVHSNRWEKGMIKFCHQQGHHQEAWEIERFSYKKASTLVKLKVLKILLEYQFTCHPKFKTAVNAISCKELRLDPIGRDQNGCAYWLQIDDDANLCLYKEDQDEETWQLIARNREELVKVIGQLKNGEEICASQTSNANEDSSSSENQTQESQPNPQSNPQKPEVEVEEEENEEEFLSPESESEHEIDTEQKEQQSSDPLDGNETNVESSDPLENEQTDEIKTVNDTQETLSKITETQSESTNEKQVENVIEPRREDIAETSPVTCEKQDNNETEPCEKIISEKQSENIVEESQNVAEIESQSKNINETEEQENVPEIETIDTKPVIEKEISEETTNSQKASEDSKGSESILEDEEDSTIKEESISEENKIQNEEVSAAIEEPVIHVTGEGNGADCDSYFIGEEISEPVMFFCGEGCGYDNDTGNPEAIEETNQAESEEENEKEEVVNGEHEIIKTKSKLSKTIRLKTVNKRSLKKQSNDTKPDTKKPCVRDTDKSHDSKIENDFNRETSVNDKSTTDNESPRKNNVKKGRSKVKKKAAKKLKSNCGKEAINSVSETDTCQDKTSIIEKRKSSVSSVDQDDGTTEVEKEKTPDKELKVEDSLPTKKLRLETTPESEVNATHSKDVSDSIENKDNSNHDPISKRKKIKASKGKFKRKSGVQNKQDLDKSSDIDNVNDSPKKGNKSLKRSLIEDPMSDKNKSESQSESEDDEPITSGKRLKIKPKKIITSSRKKVEAKLLEKQSSDESEEETLYSLAGKKSTKKLVKKKPKGKSKDKKTKAKSDKPNSDESDTPVRQSRRIAQQKIKEEAERRHLEEVALREMKMIHKKKGKDDDEEEEWRASGRSSEASEAETKRKHQRTWRASDSTGPEPDSESDSPLFDLQPEPEPEHDYGKSDHEFSPESDLESGETAEPLKRARTLQEEKDDGFCKRCGSAEQPEWILLCDKCDAGYHASCLKPMLFVIPEGDWFCPPCNHDKLIEALESELVKYDVLLAKVEEERARKKLEEPPPEPEEEKRAKIEAESEGSSDSSWSTSSDDAAVYRLRARRQLPVSYRSQEYDRMISAAIKEEYVEPTTSAGNQGRGKDISTIIEAAEEEKMKAEREAIEQGKPVDLLKKLKKKQRRKPRKLNSLDVPSEDDDETDEDFKDVGGASSSEDISSSADKESSDSRSSDSLPIRRTGRTDKKERPKMTESSPESKKKKGVFEESSSESAGAKEWNASTKPKSKSHSRPKKRDKHDKRDKRDRRDKSKKSRRSRGLTQYDAEGNVIRARVTYGGLSGGEGENDWSPKHRTRQKKINYTEMPNTESEDEMHKSSGKHMPDSSDEFKCSDSEFETDSDSDRTKKRKEEENLEREKALSDLVKKTAVVPLEKLPEDVTKAKTEELEAHLNAQAANSRPMRGKGSRGGRGSRGPRGRGGGRSGVPRAGSPQTDDALAKLVGVKIKELGQDGSPVKSSQLEREKKRQEREVKQAEKEAKKLERLQKKEEKEKLKEQKAKEREEKRLARLALQESKRVKKEKEFMGPMGGYGVPIRPLGAESPRVNNMNMNMFNHMRPSRPAGPGGPGPPGPGGPGDGPDQRFPNAPRLQVRAELRGVLTGEERQLAQQRAALQHREGTLSVAGSPQPFKPVSEEPSIITRMPHMINQQFRGPMMYQGGAYGARQQGVYGLPRPYPPHYYRLPPAYPAPAPPAPSAQHPPSAQLYRPHLQGPSGPPPSMHHNQGPSLHHSGGYYRAAPPGQSQGTSPGPPGPGGSPMGTPGPHSMPGAHLNSGPMGGPPHNVTGTPFLNRSPGPNPSPSTSGAQPMPGSQGTPLTSGAGARGAPLMPSRLFGAPEASPMPGLAMPGAAGGSGAPGPSAQAGQEHEPLIRIKAEVKTEPEYRSPVASPGAASPSEAREEPPRHPKIKVTERRPRFPLGPYAPHLAPYRPYAPPPHHPGPPPHHSGPPSHHPGPPSHHPGPPSHHPGPPSHHTGPPPHHPGQPPHHTAPPHPLQLRDPSQFMERARSPAPNAETSPRYPPHLPRPYGNMMRMPPPHPPHLPPQYPPPGAPPPRSQPPHVQSPLAAHSQPPQSKSPHSQSPHASKATPPPHGAPARGSMPFPPHLPAIAQRTAPSPTEHAVHQPFVARPPLRPQSPHSLQPAQSPHNLQPGQSPHSLQPSQSPHSLQPSQSPHSLQPSQSPHSLQPAQSPHSLQPAQSPHSLPPYRPPPAHLPPARAPAERSSPPYPLYTDRRVVPLPQPVPRDPSPQHLESLDAPPESPPPPPLDRVKVEREEGVFGGLVSYFSSQHEDDMDG